jgi:hypothetical protein
MTISIAMGELVEKVRELGVGDFFDGMDYDEIIEMGLYYYGKHIEENLEDIMEDMEIDSESDEVDKSGGDYTTCSTCPNRITYEDFGVNGGQCYECNPDLIEETDYLEEDDE